MEKFKCCNNPDLIQVYFENGKVGFRCWSCDYTFKPGEPLPEYLDIDEELLKMFNK